MKPKNQCILINREIESENKIKHSYKTDNCTINVISIFNTQKSIKDFLISEVKKIKTLDLKM